MELHRILLILTTAIVLSYPVSCLENTAAMEEKCVKSTQVLAVKECPDFSCRDKCNKTHEALTSGGRTQLCKCDEECIQYGDCCLDFASVCPDTHSDAQKKYAGHIFDTQCRGGVHVFEENYYGTTIFASSTTSTESSNAVQNFISHLIYNTAIVEDKAKGIMKTIHPDILFQPDPNVIWHDIQANIEILGAPPYNGHLNFMPLVLRNFTLLKKVGRPCESKSFYFSCPSCHRPLQWKQLCSPQSMYVNLNGTDTEQETETRVEKCFKKATFLDLYQNYSSFASATLHRISSQRVIRILSDELPWRILQCSLVGNNECKIITCAQDRILSHDGRSCFIPNILSIFVITTQNEALKPNKESVIEVPPSPYLCLAIYQLIYNHKKWNIGRVYVRPLCSYHIRFSKNSNDGKTKGMNNSENHENIENEGENMPQYYDIQSTYSMFRDSFDRVSTDASYLPSSATEKTRKDPSASADHSTVSSSKKNAIDIIQWEISQILRPLGTKDDFLFEMDNIWGLVICLQATHSSEALFHRSENSQLNLARSRKCIRSTQQVSGKEKGIAAENETCDNPYSHCFTFEIPMTMKEHQASSSARKHGSKLFHRLKLESSIVHFLCFYFLFAVLLLLC